MEICILLIVNCLDRDFVDVIIKYKLMVSVLLNDKIDLSAVNLKERDFFAAMLEKFIKKLLVESKVESAKLFCLKVLVFFE